MQGLAKNQDCVVEPVHFLIDCISPQQFVTDTLLSAGIDLKQGKGGREYTFTPVSAERNDNLEDNDEVGINNQGVNSEAFFSLKDKVGPRGICRQTHISVKMSYLSK